MGVSRLEHVTIRCRRRQATRDFYVGLIGLEEGPRPDFPFRGHWLYLGGVPVAPAWNAEMFAFQSARIDSFRTMLAESDGSPILVAADSVALGPLGVTQRPAERLVVLPNPTMDGLVEIRQNAEDLVEYMALFDVRGNLIDARPERRANGWRLRLPDTPGVYFVHLRVNGAAVLQRVVRR